MSREDQEPTSESPPSTQPQTRCPGERCNGTQRAGQLEEGGDYRQDGKVPAQSPCKEPELDGSTTPSVPCVQCDKGKQLLAISDNQLINNLSW